MDNAAYTASLDGTTIVMTSGTVTFGQTNIVITKRFSADLLRRGIDVEYSVKNVGSAAITIAPWIISRVLPNGLTFYPTGELYTTSDFSVQDQGGISWMDYATEFTTTAGKVFADGTGGWLAHADSNLVFITAFADTAKADQAPGEGEVEMYLSANYEEVELQGPYASIDPNASSSWPVRFYLRPLPSGASATVGDTTLADFVNGLPK
jgi:hypothetical protein